MAPFLSGMVLVTGRFSILSKGRDLDVVYILILPGVIGLFSISCLYVPLVRRGLV